MPLPGATSPKGRGPVIRLEDVRLGFDDREVLAGISFTVQAGETRAVLGETGTGKTLILKLCAGLLRPDSGRVVVLGQEVSATPERELPAFRRKIGFVFQEGALFDSLTVKENVAFALREEQVAEDEVETRVREALRFVEMEPALERFPPELSGGMRRRVSIARALVTRPELAFYDSPTAGLDPVTAQTIIALIIRLRDAYGVTSLLATHRVQDAFAMANFCFVADAQRIVRCAPDAAGAARPHTNIMVLRDGRAYFAGETSALLEAQDRYLQQFLVPAG